ncbi:chorismate--pyruvate lyase family protein [Ottowia thiooxydans]|uniref:chorismate--pyruvate lyase family protein n=1 Tax=Ottowia thiooxydans TaxID=219182 RepID=UPI000684B472|nr:chorismate lyase [Ottowia thiooxydans]
MSQYRYRTGAQVPRSADTSIKAWLFAGGSLTARLRAHGTVEVVVVRQGALALWLAERRDLTCRCVYAREVILLLNGRAAVWARSVTPLPAFHGAWKSLAGLGTRPLAELLFQGRSLDRDALVPHRLLRHGPESRWVRQSTVVAGHVESPLEQPTWGRSSVFWRKGQPLRVFEAFAPWVTQLPTPRAGP